MATYDAVEGQTGDIDFRLKVGALKDGSDGAPPSTQLPGTPVLLLKDRNGTAVDTTGDVTVLDSALWRVRYSPDGADLLSTKSPYSMRWKVTDGGKDYFWPHDAADVLYVHPQ